MSEYMHSPEQPNMGENLSRLFEYLDSAEANAYASLLVALAMGEEIEFGGEDDNLLDAISGTGEETEISEVVKFTAKDDRLPDTVTEKGKLQQDHDIIAFQYADTLEAAGLKLLENVFTVGVRIVDGEKFASALATIDQPTPQLSKGLENTLQDLFRHAERSYLPSIDEEETGEEEDEISDLISKLQLEESWHILDNDPLQDGQSITELQLHADSIATQFERLELDEGTVRQLRAFRSAIIENMLPEWARASNWQLFMEPTNYPPDAAWTEWGMRPWEFNLFTFLDTATAKKPESLFLKAVIEGMIDNVDKLVRGELKGSKHLAARAGIDYYSERQRSRLFSHNPYDEKYEENFLVKIEQRLRSYLTQHD